MNDPIDTRLLNAFTYHAPKPDQPATYELIRDVGLLLALVVDGAAGPYMAPTAIERIREAVMWANAAIACADEPSHGVRSGGPAQWVAAWTRLHELRPDTLLTSLVQGEVAWADGPDTGPLPPLPESAYPPGARPIPGGLFIPEDLLEHLDKMNLNEVAYTLPDPPDDAFLAGALAETKRVRAGLRVIAGHGCETYTHPKAHEHDQTAVAGTCFTNGRTADAPYMAERGCYPCIARWVLDDLMLPTEADSEPDQREPGTTPMPVNPDDPYLAEREALLALEDVVRNHRPKAGRARVFTDALARLDEARDLGPNA